MCKSIRLLTVWIFLALGACTKTVGYHVEEFKEIKVEDLPDEVKIPSKAWDLLEFKAASAEGHHEAKAEGESGGEGHKEGAGAGSGSKEVTFAAVKVFLVQKNDGIVNGEAVKIELPKGGGDIDLSQYLTGNNGSFYVGFEFPDFVESTAQRVLFVSHARKRKIDDQVYGAGCNQILDITNKFMLAMKGEGLKVNTTRERHLSTIGGTFLFSAQKAGSILVAQVSFKDPKHQSLFCEE
ncbi:MAG: hypothetical protein ACM3MG_06685 [Bacillota bacterium]